jgi:hypothetical protein
MPIRLAQCDGGVFLEQKHSGPARTALTRKQIASGFAAPRAWTYKELHMTMSYKDDRTDAVNGKTGGVTAGKSSASKASMNGGPTNGPKGNALTSMVGVVTSGSSGLEFTQKQGDSLNG